MTTMTLPPRTAGNVADVTLPLVTAIETTWSAIRAQHPDVPLVAVTLGAGATVERGRLGHFAAGPWQSVDVPTVLRLDGARLQQDAATASDLLATLLHVAAHGIARTRGAQETSRQGRYHNRTFHELADEVGLVVENDAAAGWVPAGLTEETAAAYRLADLGAALAAYQPTEPPTVPDRNRSAGNGIAAVCGCTPARRIRVRSREMFELGPVDCGICHQPFTIER